MALQFREAQSRPSNFFSVNRNRIYWYQKTKFSVKKFCASYSQSQHLLSFPMDRVKSKNYFPGGEMDGTPKQGSSRLLYPLEYFLFFTQSIAKDGLGLRGANFLTGNF
jgi:hypothetical protein